MHDIARHSRAALLVLTLVVALHIAFAVIMAPAIAQAPATNAPAPESIVFTTVVSSRLNPESVLDEVNAAMSHPVIGPVIVLGAAYLGVPPDTVAALGASAAAAGAERTSQEQQQPRRGYHIYSIKAPEGYAMCAVRFGAISIHPRKKERPKVWATASSSGLTFHVDHQTQQWLRGRSTVKTYIDVLTVRNDARARYEAKCLPDTEQSVLPLCRGADCDAYMTRQNWLHGA
ncbi:hypothetical protein [Massilia sp. YIM B02443]|uniref:hypothetical protein n=1 Tax=Massilia sp. YIM B02443 TaxID=3050127 RepID=UPI0025B6B7AF|nr:hypothetical protein [Massilia sp. YIM B02443]MDN4035754.1 hypothetical protein [Massilia sp. YIM B02443]